MKRSHILLMLWNVFWMGIIIFTGENWVAIGKSIGAALIGFYLGGQTIFFITRRITAVGDNLLDRVHKLNGLLLETNQKLLTTVVSLQEENQLLKDGEGWKLGVDDEG